MSVKDYYESSSCKNYIPRIGVPGLVVHAKDDPLIPADLFRDLAFPPRLALELTVSGGHVGYFSRDPCEGDRHWLEARLAAWLTDHWDLPG